MVDVVMLFTRWEKGRDQGRKLGDIASREVATGNNAALLVGNLTPEGRQRSDTLS